MNRTESLETPAWVKGEKKPWSPTVKLILAFVLSLIIAIIYKNTHKGLSYSQSFTFTLIFIGLLINVVMMVIGNSLALAFGAFGAFSLIADKIKLSRQYLCAWLKTHPQTSN